MKQGMACWFLVMLILGLIFIILFSIWFVSLKGQGDALLDQLVGWF